MWQTVDDKLYQKFTFKDFNEALGFINRVAEIANELNHHPKIHNTWNTVELWLSTHDAGDVVTDKDKDFAAKVDAMMKQPAAAPTVVSIKEVKLYADGGSRGNPGPSASGYVITDMDNNILKKSGVYLGITTNNQAEYQALKFGLEEVQKLGAREVEVYMDSLLVINQLKGVYKIKNRDLWPIHEAIKEIAKQLKKVNYFHIPRELNKLADAEVNTTLDAEAAK